MRTPAAWLRACKRREPGIYGYRTRQHLAPWKTEHGYVGKSRHLGGRHACHQGTCGRHANCVEKPWFDLVTYRWTIQLPWWLGWDWVTLSLETLAIWLLRPRYNRQKNPRRDKVGPREQRLQRRLREAAPAIYRAQGARRRALNLFIRFTAVALIIIGFGGYFLWGR